MTPLWKTNRLGQRTQCNGKLIRVYHVLPFVKPALLSRRAPEEQNRYEHWKDAAQQAYHRKRGRQNTLTGQKGNPGSVQRSNILTPGDMISRGAVHSVSYELHPLPILFTDGKPNVDDLLQFCIENLQESAVGERLVHSIHNHEVNPLPLAESSNPNPLLHVEVASDSN